MLRCKSSWGQQRVRGFVIRNMAMNVVSGTVGCLPLFKLSCQHPCMLTLKTRARHNMTTCYVWTAEYPVWLSAAHTHTHTHTHTCTPITHSPFLTWGGAMMQPAAAGRGSGAAVWLIDGAKWREHPGLMPLLPLLHSTPRPSIHIAIHLCILSSRWTAVQLTRNP